MLSVRVSPLGARRLERQGRLFWSCHLGGSFPVPVKGCLVKGRIELTPTHTLFWGFAKEGAEEGRSRVNLSESESQMMMEGTCCLTESAGPRTVALPDNQGEEAVDRLRFSASQPWIPTPSLCSFPADFHFQRFSSMLPASCGLAFHLKACV